MSATIPDILLSSDDNPPSIEGVPQPPPPSEIGMALLDETGEHEPTEPHVLSPLSTPPPPPP